jgi:hypothetical protein
MTNGEGLGMTPEAFSNVTTQYLSREESVYASLASFRSKAKRRF